jgi:hypothetical protein
MRPMIGTGNFIEVNELDTMVINYASNANLN